MKQSTLHNLNRKWARFEGVAFALFLVICLAQCTESPAPATSAISVAK